MDHLHPTHRFSKGETPAEFDADDLFGYKHKPAAIEGRYPESPGSKASGTSADAAAAIACHATRLRGIVLREFMAAGQRGLTADQAARLVEESILSVRPRVTELKTAGLLVPTGERRANDSGMSAGVLKASEKAFEALT
jgi:hypothetical protein